MEKAKLWRLLEQEQGTGRVMGTEFATGPVRGPRGQNASTR